MEIKKILITGGAGFLGSHLCLSLLQRGHFVTVLDNEITGSLLQLADSVSYPNFSYVKHDIREPYMMDSVDEIYHLACLASPKHYLAHPIMTWETSVLGMRHVLHLAAATKATVLFTSTSEVYGDPLVHPQPESYWGNVNTVGPRSCYDEGKRAAETLCYEYAKLGVDVRVVRLFNTYGPRMDGGDGRVVPQFITQALRGDALTVYGAGSQTRSFCYVDDMVRGLCAVMESSSSYFGPINLGSQDEYTVIDLARKIVDLIGSKSVINYLDLPLDDPKLRRPDLTLVKRLLGWQSTVALDEGLRSTIAYFKEVG